MCKFKLEIGNTLPNGAVILDITPPSDRNNLTVVLATWEKGASREWISWWCDSDGNCEVGRYSNSLPGAVAVYMERTGRQ